MPDGLLVSVRGRPDGSRQSQAGEVFFGLPCCLQPNKRLTGFLMLPTNGLREWLAYDDRQLPATGMLTIQQQKEQSEGDVHAPGWRSDQWSVSCALIPTDCAQEAMNADFDASYCFSTRWNDKGEFCLGFGRVSPFPMAAFVLQRSHALGAGTVVELRQDFAWYHKLDRPSPGVYFHPRENIEVAHIEFPHHPDALATVIVHLDFLRDYLAARGKSLLLWFVADRFATFQSRQEIEDIGVSAQDRQNSAPGEFRQVDVVEVPDYGGFWRVRSTLWRSYLIEGYGEPKRERNAWLIPSRPPQPGTNEFYLDEDGTKGPLSDPGCPPYLHFRREVLRRYLETDGFRLFFHMRRWGFGENPEGDAIDIGINENGQVTAFARDIAKIPLDQQAYWSSHSCFPTGGVCRELWQTRMQCDPPHSPNVLELMEEARQAICDSLEPLTSTPLYHDGGVEQKDRWALTVGPLSDDLGELARLAKLLYQLCLETLDVRKLRRAVEKQPSPEPGELKNWGSIRCLQALAELLGGAPQEEAIQTCKPLKDLNSIRQMDAHAWSLSAEHVGSMYGVDTSTSMVPLWDAIVDRSTTALRDLACLIRGVRP